MTIEQPIRADFSPSLAAAAGRIAPLWPLDSFVAVNPYLGHVDQKAGAALQHLARTSGAAHVQPWDVLRTAFKSGEIVEADIAAARDELAFDISIPALIESMLDDAAPSHPMPQIERLPTVATSLQTDRNLRIVDMVVARFSAWAAAYFDAGQATAQGLQRADTAFQSWLQWARADRTLDILKAGQVRAFMRRCHGDRELLLNQLLADLGVTADIAEIYIERLLRDIAGWAGYARQLQWGDELAGDAHLSLVKDLAVMRLAYDAALLSSASDAEQGRWRDRLGAYTREAQSKTAESYQRHVLLQAAYEQAQRRRLHERFQDKQSPATPARLDVQAAFCIDVRSERIRRAVETTVPYAQTLGFAGFFGFAFELRVAGADKGRAQCPVLLNPSHLVQEKATATDHKLRRRARMARAMKRFKNSAVGSFAFVDAAGLFFGAKLISDALGLTAPIRNLAALIGEQRSDIRPEVNLSEMSAGLAGYSLAEQIDVAENALRGMSLTDQFARLVLFVGHESHSRNNPHAAGLQCGACGGNSGEMNARVAALVLNNQAVRAGLSKRGIAIPDETVFLGAVHNTTTDRIDVFDHDLDASGLSPDHIKRLSQLQIRLGDATAVAQAERAPELNLEEKADLDGPAAANLAQQLERRAKDWAQVRPEWGLAGCTSFIIAQRHRTSQHHLDGKTFLHTYDAKADPEHKVLEAIMTAPMVVASWINLQYYASTLDNRAFGAGDKTLHNVVGNIGVQEGNGGDLRGGLPLQSVHDGARAVHQPARLHVVIEAPKDAIYDTLQKHSHIKALVENKWIYISAMDKLGRISHSYDGDGTWTSLLVRPGLGEKDIAA